MTVAPFKPEDLDEIDLQPGQTSWIDNRDPEYAQELARHLAVTARAGTRIVACAGVLPLDRDVGIAWAFVARDAGRHFVRFRRMVLRMLQISGKRRMLATTECDFAMGCRWLQILGFERIDTDVLEVLGRPHFVFARGV